MRLQSGLSDEVLLSRIVRFHQLHARSERGLGYYLLDFERRGLFRKYGCAGTVQFAAMKLQLPPRKTRELLRMARALERLPGIDRAYATNRISWSAVRELTRVATKETEAEWIELAENQSLRKIEHVVSRTKKGEPPCRDAYALTGTNFKVVAELPPEDYAVWEAAFARVASQAGHDSGEGHADTQLDAASVLMVLAQSFLEQPLNKAEKERRTAFQVVYHRCPDCERAWLQTVEGAAGIPAPKVAQREPVANVVCLDEADKDSDETQRPGTAAVACAQEDNRLLQTDHAPRGSLEAGDDQRVTPLESFTLSSKNTATSTRRIPRVPLDERDVPNSPAIRHQVMMRDGLLCAAPGCLNRAELNIHHVIWRSHGGRTRARNLICLCKECHSLVHSAFLEIRMEEVEEHGVTLNKYRWFDKEGNELIVPIDAKQKYGHHFGFKEKSNRVYLKSM